MIRWLQNNHLLLLTTLVFLGSLVLLMYTIDKSVFQYEKKWVIVEKQIHSKQFNLKIREAIHNNTVLLLLDKSPKKQKLYITHLINSGSDIVSVKKTTITKAEIIANLKKHSSDIISEKGSILTKIQISDSNSQTEFLFDEKDIKTNAPPKTHSNNTFKNCLFIRNFEEFSSLLIQDFTITKQSEIADTQLGVIRFYYTSPANNSSIELLTSKFRWLSLGIIAIAGGFYFYLVYFLILPVKKVVSRIRTDDKHRTTILPKPRSMLERQFNDMARDVMLTAVNNHLGKVMAQSENPTKRELLVDLEKLICEQLMLQQVVFFEADLRLSGDLANFTQLCPPLEELDFVDKHDLDRESREVIVQALLDIKGQNGRNNLFTTAMGKGQNAVISSLINWTEESRQLNLMLGVPRPHISGEIRHWLVQTLDMVSRQIHTAIAVLEMQHTRIVSEKRQANINLSDQLGHDLTNVIATSKFDLLTVKKYLEAEERQIENPSKRFQLFCDSVSHLVNNTRFLQEIVNIYRSFTYTRNPRYEPVQLNVTLEEITQIFRLSTSQRFAFNTDLDPQVPECNLEIRLIKLAIFNLLNNAVEALKRKVGQQDEEFILLQTRFLKKDNRIKVTITDTGPGIRDREGNLLADDDVDQIFNLGVSTKKEEKAGGGLGLNWVQTIITEFHHGTISAHNLDCGGAEFTIVLPAELEASTKPSEPSSFIKTH